MSNSMARLATIECQHILDRSMLGLLKRNCPGLADFDWQNYLLRSECRIEKVLKALDYRLLPLLDSPILDFGSWLGNFSIAVRLAGIPVTSAEMWARYSPALDAQKQLLSKLDVDVIDTSMIVGRPQGPHYSAVLLMSVIEHLSDSPRRLLKILYDALLPGGLFILDTPNLASIANRQTLNRGESPHTAIKEYFYSESPFEGHVREYTAYELQWMLKETGFEVIETQWFNYSGITFWESPIAQSRMKFNSALRELIFMIGRKP